MDAVRRLGSEGVDCGITLVESSTGITIDKGGIAAHDGMTIPRKRVNAPGPLYCVTFVSKTSDIGRIPGGKQYL